MTNPKTSIRTTRILGKEFCELRVELTQHPEGSPRFTITVTTGEVMTKAAARKYAKQYWVSFFEDEKGQIQDMNSRFNKQFRTAAGAAQFVLDTDGEFHGLDVHAEEGDKILISQGGGANHEAVKRFFPEAAPLLAYHLNDMHAGCEHQDALGWGPGKDVALVKGDLTPVQEQAIQAIADTAVRHIREKAFASLMEQIQGSKSARFKLFEAMNPGKTMTVFDDEALLRVANAPSLWPHNVMTKEIKDHLTKTIPAPPFESTIYKDSLCAPCPTCGYRYGTKWLTRELPQSVLTWVEEISDFDGEVVKLKSLKKIARRHTLPALVTA